MTKPWHKKFALFSLLLLPCIIIHAQKISNTIVVDSGWANNSVNTVVFRKNSLCTYNNTQYISFYNKDAFVVLGKRKLGTTKWDLVINVSFVSSL